MSDNLPVWAMEKARETLPPRDDWIAFDTLVFENRIARALVAERERAAIKAKTWLEDWGFDLKDTSDAYRESIKSGVMNGRKISPAIAKTYGRQFNERSEAVYDCGEQVAAAIRKGE